eukprot:gene8942-biopygen4620
MTHGAPLAIVVLAVYSNGNQQYAGVRIVPLTAVDAGAAASCFTEVQAPRFAELGISEADTRAYGEYF